MSTSGFVVRVGLREEGDQDGLGEEGDRCLLDCINFVHDFYRHDDHGGVVSGPDEDFLYSPPMRRT